jgi:SAM-dependent methyltransferase
MGTKSLMIDVDRSELMGNQYQELPGTPSANVTEQTVRNRAQVILEVLGGRPVGVSLDAGCGLGVYLDLLSTHSSKVVGIDIIGDRLGRVTEHACAANAHLACMALEHIGFPDRTFDFIICIETLEHVVDDTLTIQEFRRLLKPGGRVVISVPYKWFLFETHGVRVGSRVVSSPFGLGFPLLPFLPASLRKLFATVRVYSARQLVDMFERKVKSRLLVRFLRKVFGLLQGGMSKVWGSTIVIVGQVR